MPQTRTVVIVEDDFLIAEYLRMICCDIGAEVVGMASEPGEAIELIERQAPEHVLMDVRLGSDRDGVDVAMQVHKTLPDTKITFVTGSNEPPTLDRIAQDHPHRVLIKPINTGQLKEALMG